MRLPRRCNKIWKVPVCFRANAVVTFQVLGVSSYSWYVFYMSGALSDDFEARGLYDRCFFFKYVGYGVLSGYAFSTRRYEGDCMGVIRFIRLCVWRFVLRFDLNLFHEGVLCQTIQGLLG